MCSIISLSTSMCGADTRHGGCEPRVLNPTRMLGEICFLQCQIPGRRVRYPIASSETHRLLHLRRPIPVLAAWFCCCLGRRRREGRRGTHAFYERRAPGALTRLVQTFDVRFHGATLTVVLLQSFCGYHELCVRNDNSVGSRRT